MTHQPPPLPPRPHPPGRHAEDAEAAEAAEVAVAAAPGDLDEPSRGGRRRGWLVAASTAAAVGLLGVVLVRVADAPTSGAATPAEAVEQLLTALAAEDGVAALDTVVPAETAGAEELLTALEDALTSLEGDTGEASPELEVTLEGLELAADEAGDDAYRVRVTDGAYRIAREDGGDLDDLPVAGMLGMLDVFAFAGMGETSASSDDDHGWYAYAPGDGAFESDLSIEWDESGEPGAVVSEEVDPDGQEGTDAQDPAVDGTGVAPATETAVAGEVGPSLDLAIRDLWTALTWTVAAEDLAFGEDGGIATDPGDPSFVVVRQDGGWHVSLVGTVADLVAGSSGQDPPDLDGYGDALAAEGVVGETPEDAVRVLVESPASGEVTDVLAALPADLAAVLHPFAPLLQADLDDAGVVADLTVTDLATSTIAEDGDRVRLRVDRLVVDGTLDDGHEALEGPFVVDGGCLTLGGEETCLPAWAADDLGVDGLVLDVRAVDGGYQVDPVATLLGYATRAVDAGLGGFLDGFVDPRSVTDPVAVTPGGETAVPVDGTGHVLLEVEATAGQVLSVGVDRTLETLDFYSPGSEEPEHGERSATWGVWDEDATTAAGALLVTETGAHTVHLWLGGGDLPAELTVAVHLDDTLPSVGYDEPVALQHGTYGLALVDLTDGAAAEYGYSVTGAASITYCAPDRCDADLVLAVEEGVTVVADSFEEGPADAEQYRPDAGYDVEVAEATLVGSDEGWLDLPFADGASTVAAAIEVTAAGTVLLNVMNHQTSGDVAVVVRDAAGTVVCEGDRVGEYGDEYCDFAAVPGTYDVEVAAVAGDVDDPGFGVSLYLAE
ncbi:hypothetical protein ACOACO_03930 [Nocardioides sp. CPCC 205120]|uniref:hypothetical protein n=1 Tax=Nocardioides sp. CPCC 205120 TaxID=3406462 RepID=UPI003B51054E